MSAFPYTPDRKTTPPETDCLGNFTRCTQCGCYYDDDLPVPAQAHYEDVDMCLECLELRNSECKGVCDAYAAEGVNACWGCGRVRD